MADTYFSKRDLKNISTFLDPIEKEKWDNGKAKRKILRIKNANKPSDEWQGMEIAEVDDTQAKHQKGTYPKGHKMAPYTVKGWFPKHERENKGYRKSGFPNTSKRHKEIIKNANRSMKKTVRQQWRKELRKELENE